MAEVGNKAPGAQHNTLLTAGELRAVVDTVGLEISAHSPLANIRSVAPQPLQRSELMADGWRSALAALAAPDHFVQVIMPMPGASRVAFYYEAATRQVNGLVGCWQEGEQVRISFPWTADSIVQDAGETLMVNLPSDPDPFSATLSPAGLTALMAAVDVIRSALLTCLLQRNVELDRRWNASQLREQIELGLAHHDARWTVTLLRILAPVATPPRAEAIDRTGRGEMAADRTAPADGGQLDDAAAGSRA